MLSRFLRPHLKSAILAGDLNSNSPLWNSPFTCQRGEHIESFVALNDLDILNQPSSIPTFESSTNTSFIDAAFASTDLASNLTQWETLDLDVFGSDHRGILFSFQVSGSPPEYSDPSSWIQSVDKEALRSKIQQKIPTFILTHPKNLLDTEYGISKTAEDLKNLILTSAKECAQHSPKPPKTRVPWWNDELEEVFSKRRLVRKSLRDNPSPQNKNDFKNLSNQLKNLTKKARRTHFANLCAKIDKPWKLYSILTKKRKQNYGTALSDQEGNPIIFDPNQNANQLLDLFFPDDDPSSDFSLHQEIRDLAHSLISSPSDPSEIPDVTPDEVTHAFANTQPFSSTPDSTPAAFYKWNLDSLASPLANIFSACIKLSYFPTCWKQGSLLTIPKNAEGADFTSHKSQRPITLLPVLGKIFEKILLRRFNHDKQDGWFNRAQRGFIKGSSTEAALFHLRSRIQSNLNSPNKGLVAISLDIAAAFDKAWHPSILKNLHDKKMPLHYIKLIASFLSDRITSLNFGGGTASKLLSRSTPQGSVLSPFLWNIFLDPLLDRLSTKFINRGLEILAWADDVLLLLPFDKRDIHGAISSIQEILTEAGLWAASNKADFGANKTKIIEFSTSKSSVSTFNLFVPGFGSINQVEKMKFLGVIFDQKLTFRDHLSYACEKIKSCLFSLKNVALSNYGVQTDHFATIFIGAILPKLLYGLPVWYTVLDRAGPLKELSKLLRLAAVMTARVAPTTPNRVLFPLAGMLPPPLLLEKELLNKLLNIVQTSFFGVEEFSELLTPSSEYMYITNQLLFAKHKISDSMLRDLFLNRLPLGPDLTHPATYKSLRVTLDKSDHLLDCLPGDLVAYTDGSKTEHGVGASAVLFQYPNLLDPIHHTVLSLPDSSEVYQAEVLGILAVPSLCDNTPQPLLIKPKNCHIFADNSAALYNLKCPSKSKYHLIKLLHGRLRSHTLNFELHWCKGHSGIWGNELADAHAKCGSEGRGDFVKPPWMKSQLTRAINDSLNSRHLAEWAPDPTSLYSKLFPDLLDLKRCASLTKPQRKTSLSPEDSLDCYFVRKMISGRYPTQDNLYTWKKASSPQCSLCGFSDSIEHHILSCPALEDLRITMCAEINFRPLHISQLLTTRIDIKALHLFLQQAKKRFPANWLQKDSPTQQTHDDSDLDDSL